jgi:transcriptional regulator GlxA family with amidase domain
MHPTPNFNRPAAQILRRYFRLLVSELSSATAPLPAWVHAQIEQLLMVMFLCANEHNYSHLLEQQPRDIAPRQVRQAEEYIEANRDRPISLEDLAAVTGVSMLSLFRSFKQSRGYSPLEFAKRVRWSQKSKH